MHGVSTNCVGAALSIFCLECLFHCTIWLWTQSYVLGNFQLFKGSQMQQWNIHWQHMSFCFCFDWVALTLFELTPCNFYT
jgi:hypothetical protein